jgi:adenine C2-methylase RlmN of 23S rRNA A2503 and tRNA A37
LVPNSLPVSQALPKLKAMKELCGIDVVFHQLFLKNMTDMKWLVQELVQLFNYQLKDFELRILRFNASDMNGFGESPKFEHIVRELLPKIPNLKLQISPGSEVQGACGQFL